MSEFVILTLRRSSGYIWIKAYTREGDWERKNKKQWKNEVQDSESREGSFLKAKTPSCLSVPSPRGDRDKDQHCLSVPFAAVWIDA